MTTQHIDAPIIETRIPEGHNVEGLEYGAHVGMTARGWSGYHVRPDGTDTWVIARLTPAADELVGDDAEIVDAISDEITDLPDDVERPDWCPHCGRADGEHDAGYSCS